MSAVSLTFEQYWINGASGYRGYEVTVREMIASYVNASSQDIVLIENASGAINAILRSLPLKRGDILLDFSTAYGPFKAFYQWLEATVGVSVLEVPIVFPLQVCNYIYIYIYIYIPYECSCIHLWQGPQDVLLPLAATLAANHSRIAIAVVSHVASYPGVVLPAKEVSIPSWCARVCLTLACMCSCLSVRPAHV